MAIEAPARQEDSIRDDDSELLALPYDVPPRAGAVYEPRVFQFEFGAGLQRRLSEAADGPNLLVTALSALLFRYSQQSRLPLGVFRPDGSLAALLVDAAAEQTGRALAEEIGHQLQSAPPWDTRGRRRARPQVTVAAGFDSVVPEPTSAMLAPPELHVWLAQSLDRGIVTYDASLFLPDTIARLLRHFDMMAEGLCENPDRPIGQLPLLTPAELRQLVVEWRPAAKAYPQRPLFEDVSRHARERPDAVAVTFKERSLSYRELDLRSNRLARYLRQQGVRGGMPVAVCAEPCLDIATYVLAIFKAGGAFVPIDPSYPAERQRTILEDVAPKVLLTQSHLRNPLSSGAVVLVVHEAFDECFAEHSSEPLDGGVGADDVGFIVYTSGTTGKPKGVMMTHANLGSYIRVAQERYRFTASDVQPAMARFSFSISMFELLSPLVAGGRLVVLERDHVLDFRRLVATLEQCTVLHASPSLLRKLVGYLRSQGVDVARLDGLRHVSSGGDLVSADLMEDLKQTFRKAELFVIYGCSEIACMGTTYEVPRDRSVTHNRVGRPFANTILRICDGNQNLVPIGIPGEIYIGGAGLARGYLNLRELTQEKFVVLDGERYYRTGDVGRYDPEGQVEILGRSDFQIKLRGMRIELSEIEQTLRRVDGVREAVVAARQLHGDKALVAYVVLASPERPSVADLRRFLQARLPDYMVPTAFVVLEALPVNVNQKIDRRALPQPSDSDLARDRTLAAPRNSDEARLLSIWRELLQTDAIGVEDGFFDAGGDSLLAVNLMVQIEKQFGKALPLSTLLTEPTVAGLARRLTSDDCRARSSVVLLREGGNRPPVFFVHDGEGEVLPYRTLAQKLGGGHPIYGIQPKSWRGYPMLHSRLGDVADYYCRQVLSIQPGGPYLLGGLCIGGFIAFEIARRLKRQGRSVAMVALIDAAHVTAKPRSLTTARARRLSEVLQQGQQLKPVARARHLLREISRKILNTADYEMRSRLSRAQNDAKMRLFRVCLDRSWALPSFLANIPVRVVLRFAEKEYVVPEPYEGEVLLFRATQRSPAFDDTLIDDTPYVDLFQDRHLGWEGKTTRGFIPFDIAAGHSSMLREPQVNHIAEAMQRYIDIALR